MTIGGKEYKEIVVTIGGGEVLAVLTDEKIIEHDDIHIVLSEKPNN